MLPAQAGVVPTSISLPLVHGVLPAQAGVVPPSVTVYADDVRAPRSGGGGPTDAAELAAELLCSPLRRGWSRTLPHSGHCSIVLPAQAGVVPLVLGLIPSIWCTPRSGGGGPWSIFAKTGTMRCSPLRRGWSLIADGIALQPVVLPAQAGVVPVNLPEGERGRGAPRSGGGGPINGFADTLKTGCSPLRRGWSLRDIPGRQRGRVLPAQAGVVPCVMIGPTHCPRAPRSGGGGPTPVSHDSACDKCSPLRRGWSLCSSLSATPTAVLPAQAGVVPLRAVVRRHCSGAPRSGGGGPRFSDPRRTRQLCSPLRRGWSHRHHQRRPHLHVLPAQAGVVPAS